MYTRNIASYRRHLEKKLKMNIFLHLSKSRPKVQKSLFEHSHWFLCRALRIFFKTLVLSFWNIFLFDLIPDQIFTSRINYCCFCCHLFTSSTVLQTEYFMVRYTHARNCGLYIFNLILVTVWH